MNYSVEDNLSYECLILQRSKVINVMCAMKTGFASKKYVWCGHEMNVTTICLRLFSKVEYVHSIYQEADTQIYINDSVFSIKSTFFTFKKRSGRHWLVVDVFYFYADDTIGWRIFVNCRSFSTVGCFFFAIPCDNTGLRFLRPHAKSAPSSHLQRH